MPNLNMRYCAGFKIRSCRANTTADVLSPPLTSCRIANIPNFLVCLCFGASPYRHACIQRNVTALRPCALFGMQKGNTRHMTAPLTASTPQKAVMDDALPRAATPPTTRDSKLAAGVPARSPQPLEQKGHLHSSSKNHLYGASHGPYITPLKSRARGISLNLAVSPALPNTSAPGPVGGGGSGAANGSSNRASLHHRRTSLSTLAQLPESPLEDVETALPSTEQLLHLGMDEQLRLLALQEMNVVEIKDHIANLETKLKKHEADLHRLREVIQKSLYKEMGVGNDSEPRDAAVRSTRRRRTLSLGKAPIIDPQGTVHTAEKAAAPLQALTSVPPGSAGAHTNPRSSVPSSSSIWSNLSKPLNLIQQFDTMLQTEFERSLAPQVSPRRLEESFSGGSSPLKDKSQLYEDKISTVSLSIWSFVSDVRTNVMSSLADEEEVVYDLGTGEVRERPPTHSLGEKRDRIDR